MAIPQWITQWLQQEDKEIEYTVDKPQADTTVLTGTIVTVLERFEDRDADDPTVRSMNDQT